MRNNDSLLIPDTLFVIVIYNCAIAKSSSFQSLCETHNATYKKDVFIYDNSALPQSLPSINIINVHYHHNPDNGGVSAAYNEAFRKAKQLNKKWLLLMDQDSLFPANAWEIYHSSTLQYPSHGVFVPALMDGSHIISPFKLKWGKGIHLKSRQPGIHSFRHVQVINSGILITTKLFESAGGYDERFPLDFSDLVFIERLAAIALEFVLTDIVCKHSLSANTDTRTTTTIVLNRFAKYCDTARLFKKVSKTRVILSYLLLPRAIKLAWVKKDIRFVTLAMKILLT